MTPRPQPVDFGDSTSLVDLLKLKAPPFARSSPFAQLEYIEKYVRSLGCRSLLIEDHYVDRDFIEDYSLFYSRSLQPFQNFCQRVHFFAASAADVSEKIARVMESLASGKSPSPEDLGNGDYLGFTIIKGNNILDGGTSLGHTP